MNATATRDCTVPLDEIWPRWFRTTLIVLATAILCSCRGPASPNHGPHSHRQPGIEGPFSAAHMPGTPQASVVADAGGLPAANGPWQPPGLKRPWPYDEYLHDGGDEGPPARVRADWRVDGIEQQDAVAHFDTADGRTVVEPTNRVHIYAPRFGAVRRVRSPGAHEGHTLVAGLEYPVSHRQSDDLQGARLARQRDEPATRLETARMRSYRNRQQGGELDGPQGVVGMHSPQMANDTFQWLEFGQLDQRQEALLLEAVDAAIVWSHDHAVSVLIKSRRATADVGYKQVGQVFEIDEPDRPRLRVVKLASKSSANPGETIEFAIRFDNVGDQVLRNVTLIDNLATRLEYIPETAQSSVATQFEALPNTGDSALLRWRLDEPLQPGRGGIVRFKCRLR